MKPFSPIKSILIWSLLVLAVTCGGANTTDEADEAEEAGLDDTVNTEKLIGTPFEGYETGDEFDWDFFLCNQYRTETIDELPIQIFTAFFTESEEEIIQEGIDVANEAMGPTNDDGVFYEMTDTWSDGVRVMYWVDEVVDNETGIEYSSTGHSKHVESRFNEKYYAETMMPDWRIELTQSGVDNFWIVAHELGHASGITGHYLIDYENDIFTDLEEDSLMEGEFLASDPELNDYNYMMQQQAQIIEAHLQELGNLGGETCTD